jgi:DNA-binding CsgD family transcriptional regulator
MAFLDLLGRAIETIGAESFPSAMTAALRALTPYSYTVAFAYRGDARPLDLFDDFPADKRRVFVADYQEGPYLLDPFYLSATRPVAEGLYRMRDLAPDRFYQGEYFRNYYIRTGLAEEIGFFTDLGQGVTVVLSLMRADRSFSARDIATLQAARGPVHALVRRHWAGQVLRFDGARSGAGGAFDRGIEQRFHAFGAGILTAREREVAELTLKGHSAEALGRALGISAGTVRIHRRNIYAKLRISSQGELFSRFMATLDGGALPPGRNGGSRG